MDTYEKAGNLAIDVAKLVIGGIILAAIMKDYDSYNSTKLFTAGAIVSTALIIVGFVLYNGQSKTTKKKKQRKK